MSALPLSITKPASLAGEPEVPLASSISESLTTVLVVSIVVVVPFTVKSPVIVALPATSKPVPFKSWKFVVFNLAAILLEPFLIVANSIKPSSVPAEASSILPVIFAYTVEAPPSSSPLNLIWPK